MKRELKGDDSLHFSVCLRGFKTDPDEKGTERPTSGNQVRGELLSFKTDPDEKGTER